MPNPPRLRAFRLLVLLVLLRTPPGLLSQTRDSANLTGTVRDRNGAPITEADVTVGNTDTGLKRQTHTDSDGKFAFAGLALTGRYILQVDKSGFAEFTREGIELRAGLTAGFDVILTVGPTHSSVVVYGAAAGVPVDSARTETSLDLKKIDETPVIGRKLTSLPLLDAAVRPARGTGDLFLNNSLYVINGSGRRQTTYSVDNSTGDDSWGRQTLFTTIPFSSLQEFTVLTNTLSAEFGRTTGGAVNLVTKSGTNEFHGDLLGLFRPGSTEARVPLSVARTEDVLQQVSGAVSGPLIKDRTHFLISAEYSHQQRDSVITAPLAQGVYTGNFRQTLMFVRLDHQLNSRNALMFRTNFDRFDDTNPQDVVGNTNLPSAARIFRRRTYATQLSETATLTGALINQFRFQHQLGSPITQFDPMTPSVQIVFPGQYTSGESRSASLLNHQFEWADTLSYLRGRHNLKLGIDVIYSSSGGFGQEFGGGFVLGQFRVKPDTDAKPPNQLTLADMASFTQSFGNAQYNIRETLWALFAQDNLRLRHDLSFEFGLRYERQTLTDTNGVSPRVGFTYLLPCRRPAVVRASYGIFFSEIRANYAAADQLNGPLGIFTFSATPGQLGFPISLAPLPAFPQGAVLPARDITVRPGQRAFLNQFFDVSKLRFFSDSLLNPYTQQWNLGLEREMAPGWTLSIDYLGQHTIRIERPVDLNAPQPFIRTAQGQNRPVPVANLTRPILPVTGGYRRIVANTNAGTAFYNGLQAKLTKRLSKRSSMLASYSWSHTIGTVEPDVPQQDPNDSNFLGLAEKATSLLDQRHRFVLSGWYDLPWQITFGGITSLASGRPFNVTTGSDNNGDGSVSDRPVVNGTVVSRNFGQGTPLYDLSLFLAKEVRFSDHLRLNLRGEVFNIFNHANFVGRDGIYGDGPMPLPTFGQALGGVSNVEPARQFQFLIRLRF